MKKNFLIVLPALLISLSACDIGALVSSLENNASDDISTEEEVERPTSIQSEEGNSFDDSIFDITESTEKLMAFGKDTGFEITTKATDSDGTDYTFVLGMKGNIWWTIDESGGAGYQLNGDKCAMLTYDVENQTWSTLIANVGETQFKAMFESLTSYLYKSNSYFANEGFTSNGEGTYARRDVLKFKYHRAVGTVSVDHEYFVDKDLGISIYQYAETRNGSEVAWAKLETTSFKTGNDVEAIVVS